MTEFRPTNVAALGSSAADAVIERVCNRGLRFALMAAALVVLTVAPAAVAQSPAPTRDWPQEKCYRFGRDWDEALRRFGREDLSVGFLAAAAAFVRSGCIAADKICPETARERKLADALAIRVVNEGMSTTFLPFDCPGR